MAANTEQLIEARERINGVLEQLGVDAYLFEVEPRGDGWELKVECAIDEGWGSFSVALSELLLSDAAARAVLLEQCQRALASCRRGQ